MKSILLKLIAACTGVVFAGLAMGATCEGDDIATPDAAKLHMLQASAEAGDSHAQALLGIAYQTGKGISRDNNLGLSLLNKAAMAGDSEAQYILGYYYGSAGSPEGDYQKAVSFLRQSVAQDCVPALYTLGALTMQGKGVAKDEAAGFQMILKAANENNVIAQIAVAGFFANGIATPKDTKAAFVWAKRAADTGDSGAQVVLAIFYGQGIGTETNSEEARTLLETVYNKSDGQSATAAATLGWMYAEGKGAQVDNLKAFQWLTVAVNAHNADAVDELHKLIERMPKQKLASACGVYMNPQLTGNLYTNVEAGETVIVVANPYSVDGKSAEVAFPDRRLGAFLSRQCLEPVGK